MSKYAGDPDVTAHADGTDYTVHTAGGDVHVLKTGALGYGLYAGPNLDMVAAPSGPGGFAWQMGDDPDTAIEAARGVQWGGGDG